MRKLILAAASLGLFGLCIYLQADGPSKEPDTIPARIQLQDAETGKAIAGIVRVIPAGETKPLPLPGLYDRLRGLKPTESWAGWHVVPIGGGSTKLPRQKVRIEAVSGLETVRLNEEFDLSKSVPEKITLKVKAAFRPEASGLVAGNTHLHLMNILAEDAEEYLRQVPAADRLRILFISFLERFKEDVNYITNRYPVGDLKQFTATGVLVNNGEEHRHNFGSHGQGYGHVMFLNIKGLVKPVSLGSGITGEGTDEVPLRPGIETARKQGGTVLWCHNVFGFEDVPNILASRIDALNVFDGARIGTYEEGYYRYLNIGMRLPISTGTDWFMYDFARVYAKVSGELTIPGWLNAVKAGRCQATNGPLLSLSVDGKEIGDVINLAAAKTVRIEALATGRHNFQTLQLVHNGRVVQTADAKEKDGVWSAKLTRETLLEESAWFAARIDSTTKNELDRLLYAHTSPVYVEFAEKRVFDIEAARGLQKLMEEARDEIKLRGKFSGNSERNRILAIYDDTAAELAKRINQRSN
jgi:hypothetical protein